MTTNRYVKACQSTSYASAQFFLIDIPLASVGGICTKHVHIDKEIVDAVVRRIVSVLIPHLNETSLELSSARTAIEELLQQFLVLSYTSD
jgi:hypothetical protein